MDAVRAKNLANKLKGREIGGWEIFDYINHGKSAVVLKAQRKGEEAAIKVFDAELIERFGRETQLIRIQREKELIGKGHPNLIEIKDGGECRDTCSIYLVMEYLPWRNLNQVLAELPRDKIFPILQQIASAAEHLEKIGLAHRDIKPENIGVADDFSQAKLLDLGVLRPVGLSEITDEHDQKVFVGTLRYSPPELLYRQEADTEEGWRAITFYQIGAVLYDMIMKQPIFNEYSDPYARLVDAVKNETPDIKAEDVDSEIILIASSCLVKEPQTRLSLVNWDKLIKPIQAQKTIKSLRDRIIRRKRIINAETKQSSVEGANSDYLLFKKIEKLTHDIKQIIRSVCLGDRECFPRFEINHYFEDDNKGVSIHICFGPSNSHHLFAIGILILNMTISNRPDKITAVTFLPLVSSPEIDFNNLIDSTKFKLLYNGKYDQRLLKERIESLLFEFIDKLQECGEIKKDEFHYIEIDSQT